MGKLEDDFPELKAPASRKIEVFRIGEEPPDWVYWRDRSPQERLRHIELLRRINFGYDPDAVEVSRRVEVVRGERR